MVEAPSQMDRYALVVLSWSKNPRSGRQEGKISVLANDGHSRPQTGWMDFHGNPMAAGALVT